jgi:hypothetical protein
MANHASGSFEIQLNPLAQDQAEGSTLGRMWIDKQLHGDLEATGKGEMLSAGTDAGSAVYVAIERIVGTLHGRSGAFVLVHHGVMTQARQELTITVVPDSGSGELAGISGAMTINIVDGQHLYEFEYTLSAVQ